MALQIGDNAPDFKLFNTEKKEVALSALRGKNVVILFFPLAFTGTCTAELCTMRDNLTTYNDLNAVILGVSVDSLFSLEKFKAEQKLNFDLLSDFNKTASAAYGSLYDDFVFGMKGVSKRSAFVADKNGKIQYAEVLEKATDQPNYDNIKACLNKLN
ncbi:MAG: redoxin domain-containing protein [Bacteroidia bacterium]